MAYPNQCLCREMELLLVENYTQPRGSGIPPAGAISGPSPRGGTRPSRVGGPRGVSPCGSPRGPGVSQGLAAWPPTHEHPSQAV